MLSPSPDQSFFHNIIMPKKEHAVYERSLPQRPSSAQPQYPLTGIPNQTAQTAADSTVESGERSPKLQSLPVIDARPPCMYLSGPAERRKSDMIRYIHTTKACARAPTNLENQHSTSRLVLRSLDHNARHGCDGGHWVFDRLGSFGYPLLIGCSCESCWRGRVAVGLESETYSLRSWSMCPGLLPVRVSLRRGWGVR